MRTDKDIKKLIKNTKDIKFFTDLINNNEDGQALHEECCK